MVSSLIRFRFVIVFFVLLGGFFSSQAMAVSEFLVYAQKLAERGIIQAQDSEDGYRLYAPLLRGESTKLALTTA